MYYMIFSKFKTSVGVRQTKKSKVKGCKEVTVGHPYLSSGQTVGWLLGQWRQRSSMDSGRKPGWWSLAHPSQCVVSCDPIYTWPHLPITYKHQTGDYRTPNNLGSYDQNTGKWWERSITCSWWSSSCAELSCHQEPSPLSCGIWQTCLPSVCSAQSEAVCGQIWAAPACLPHAHMGSGSGHPGPKHVPFHRSPLQPAWLSVSVLQGPRLVVLVLSSCSLQRDNISTQCPQSLFGLLLHTITFLK